MRPPAAKTLETATSLGLAHKWTKTANTSRQRQPPEATTKQKPRFCSIRGITMSPKTTPTAERTVAALLRDLHAVRHPLSGGNFTQK